MFRTFWSFLKIATLLTGAAWLLLHPGKASFQWEDWTLETSGGLVLLGGVSLVLLSIFLTRAWIFLTTFPTRYRQKKEAETLKVGYLTLTRGYAALTAHDVETVKRHLQEAEKKLGEVPLLLYLKATLARLEQEDQKADFLFEKLTSMAGVTALGAIPLLERSQTCGNLPLALEISSRALTLEPQAAWLLERTFSLQLQAELLEEAEKTLERLRKIRGKKAVLVHQQNLYLAQREQAFKKGKEDLSWKLTKKAYDLNPTYLPALIAMAREWGLKGKKEKAMTLIAQAWSHEPSALLMDLFRELAAGEPFSDQNAWCEKVIFEFPQHPLSIQLRQQVMGRELTA